jgi:hypothetical protein
MGQQEGGGTGKQTFQHGRVVHQHVTGGGPHEHLDAGDAGRVGGGHGVQVVGRYPR